jgi:hypothetical protein
MQHNPIDKIFKKNLDKPYKGFNQEHWGQAQLLLQKLNRARRNRRLLFILLLLLTGVGLSTIGYREYQRNRMPPKAEQGSDVPMAASDRYPGVGSEQQKGGNILVDPVFEEKEQTESELTISHDRQAGSLNRTRKSGQIVRSQLDIVGPGKDRIENPVMENLEMDRLAPIDPHFNEDQVRKPEYVSALPVPGIRSLSIPAFGISPNLALVSTSLSSSYYGTWNFGWTGTLIVNPGVEGKNELQGLQLGFVVEYPLNRHWTIGSRPHFHLTVNESGFSKFDEQVSFGFGSETTMYGLRAKSLQFASLPVYIGWNSARHRFEIGGGVNYLLAARGQLQEIDLNSSQIRPLLELESGWIETRDMKAVSANLFLGYKVRIYDKLFTGFSVFYNPNQIYPGFPNDLPQNYQRKWHFGLQTNYYFK